MIGWVLLGWAALSAALLLALVFDCERAPVRPLSEVMQRILGQGRARID